MLAPRGLLVDFGGALTSRALYDRRMLRLGVPAASVVFVDDLPGHLKPARALGMVTLRHVTARETIPELERLLGASL